MREGLSQARSFANSVRFIGDRMIASVEAMDNIPNHLRDLFYCNELAVSKEVTPGLNESIEFVLERFGAPRESVHAFVYSSPEINAQCFTGQASECILRFSSALVDILDRHEFEFVVGHELGHFLLSHTQARADNASDSIEFHIQQRAQEISADRLGLIACDSLDVAVRALMKTVSGLTSEHLRFDVGAYLSQLRKTTGSSNESSVATHPSIIVRCRALMWFSVNDTFLNKKKVYPREELEHLDERIIRDMDQFTDKSARNRIDAAKNKLEMWVAVEDIVADGRFDKDEQKKFLEKFGREKLDSLKNFLDSISSGGVKAEAANRVAAARSELESLIPYSFEEEVSKIRKWNT